MKKFVVILLIASLALALTIPALASNSQIVTNANTRIWQDGFGFHCNAVKGNGATAVEYIGDNTAIENSIARIKKQPAGSMIVQKGDQKDIFGTRTFPVTLERVGTTTTWNLITDDVECNSCGRIDWVTYSNNSGVINGKNIQVHHSATPRFPTPPVEFNSTVTFTKVKYDGYYLNGFQDVAPGEFTFNLYEIVDGEEVFVEAFTTDLNSVVTISDLAPGSYILREVPNLLWDELRMSILRAIGMMQHGDYNLVWNPAVIFIDVAADGTVTLTGDIKDGVVNNVVACKHNMLWYEHSGYTQWMDGVTNVNTPHPNGGEIVDFTGYCNGFLVPTYVEHAGLIHLICSENCGIGSTYDKNPEPPVDLFSTVSFSKVKYGGLLPVGAGEFAFDLFKIVDGAEVLVGTFKTDMAGNVTAPDLAPGSYVFKEVLAVDHDLIPGQDGTFGYRYVWNALYPNGADGLYFTITADGKDEWRDADNNPTVNNVHYCKHARQWTFATDEANYLWSLGQGWDAFPVAGHPYGQWGLISKGACLTTNCTVITIEPAACGKDTVINIANNCEVSATGFRIGVPGTALECIKVVDHVVEAGCTNRGYTRFVCEVCGVVEDITDADATGHSFVEEEGAPWYIRCTICGFLDWNPNYNAPTDEDEPIIDDEDDEEEIIDDEEDDEEEIIDDETE